VATLLPMARAGDPGVPPPFERIAIVGFGLLGGSVGLAIRQRWPESLVIAVDRRDVVETAMRMHAADVGGDDLGLAGDAQLVVLAAPVRANHQILSQLATFVGGDAIVTDVGSTKRETVAVARALPGRLAFIGGHPLAGAATRGVEAARADLFVGRPWILTPEDPTAPAVARLGSLWEGIGAHVRILTAEAHDHLVAYLSQLPQLVASALMHVVGSTAGMEGLSMAGRGLKDTTRLSGSAADIWIDIVATNRDHIARAVDELIAVLERLKTDAPEDEVAGVFESSARWKRILDGYFDRR
jgi:prephenate dehydrogenase